MRNSGSLADLERDRIGQPQRGAQPQLALARLGVRGQRDLEGDGLGDGRIHRPAGERGKLPADVGQQFLVLVGPSPARRLAGAWPALWPVPWPPPFVRLLAGGLLERGESQGLAPPGLQLHHLVAELVGLHRRHRLDVLQDLGRDPAPET